jgi:hypothetical protein
MSEEVVDRREIEAHLAGEFRLEGSAFRSITTNARKFQMVKEEIDVEVLVSDCDPLLSRDQRKTNAQFEEKLAQVIE